MRRIRPSRRPRPESLEPRALLTAFVVTSAADSGPGTLRDAITQLDADTSSAADSITFDIPGSGVKILGLVTPLPDVTRAAVIDGTSEPGYVASSGPLIEIDGKGLAADSDGLRVSDGTTVEGLAIGDFAGGTGVVLVGGDPDAVGDVIEGDYIGVAPDGTTAMPNQVGISVSPGSSTIGGTTAAARDVISGNVGDGIDFAATSSGDVVEGDFIGTDAAGDAKLGNGQGIEGVSDSFFGAKSVTIGGTVAGAGNVISGNTTDAIGGSLTSSLIAGNLIGLDSTGTKALGNGSGIAITGDGTTIGGTTAAARNVISANVSFNDGGAGYSGYSGTGISLAGQGNLVEGNYIGPDVTGKAAVPALTGTGNVVGLSDTGSDDTIGGTAAGAGNVISGNSGIGLSIMASGILVEGNLIGTDATGSASLGNGGAGIAAEVVAADDLAGSLPASIGGTAAGAGNTIAYNLGGGINVQLGQIPNYVPPVTIRGNSIFGNSNGGISGPPSSTFFTSESVAGGLVTFAGDIIGKPGATEIVDIYANPAADPTGAGQGQVFLGTVTATIDGGGFGHFSGSLATPSFASPVLSALTTGADGSTTAFSKDFPVAAGTTGNDLSIAASVSPAAILANGDATFTFTVTNQGTTAADEPVVTVAVPEGLTDPLAFSPGVTGANAAGNSIGVVSAVDGVITANLFNLAPGQSVALTVVATVTASGPVGLIAGVYDDGIFDPDLGNNEATATVTPAAPSASTATADLAITGLALPSPTTANGPADFKLTVTNSGTSAATDVVVRDTETGGPHLTGSSLDIGSVTPSQGAVASISGTGNNEYYYVIDLGTIPAGGSATVVIASTAFQAGTAVVNVAKVSSDQYDPTPADNTIVQSIGVDTGYDPSRLSITQFASPAAPAVGSPLTYAIDVDYAFNVEEEAPSYLNVLDVLPAGVDFVSASSSLGNPARYDASTRTVTFPIAFLTGYNAKLTLVVTPTVAAGALSNTAVLTGNDPTVPLTSATSTVSVAPAPPVITPVLKQAPADFDGDGKSDLAIYLPAFGEFAYRPSSGGPDVLVPFGFAGDGRTIPAVGDYTGAGHAEIAAYLPSIGAFAIRPSTGADEIIPFGFAGAGQTIPAAADYFGTGVDDIAAYLPSIGAFAIRPPTGADEIVPFGFAGAGQTVPAPADYFGTGQADIAAYLPSIGAFAIRNPAGGPDEIIPFGLAGAGQSIPVPGDYDGSGHAEIAVYMPSLGLFAYRPADGGPDVIEPFGVAGNGSVPAVGDYTGSGRDDIAIFDPNTAVLAYRPPSGPDVLIGFGAAGVGGSLPVLTPASTLIGIGTTATAASISSGGSSSPARFVANSTSATALAKAVPQGPALSMRTVALARVAQSADPSKKV